MSFPRSRSGGICQLDRIDPVQQILPESTFLDHRMDIHIRGRDQPDIDRYGAGSPQTENLSFLDSGQ